MSNENQKPKGTQFTFLLYPENLPVDWETRLRELDIPMAISPLHNKDIDKKMGGFKKPHYHGIAMYKNPITRDGMTKRLNRALAHDGCKNCVPQVQFLVKGVKSTYLYLTHESDSAIEEGKHVYDSSDIKLLNNFDISRYVVLDASEKEELLRDLLELIYKYRLANMFQLLDYLNMLRDKGEPVPPEKDVLDVVRSNTGMLRMYFDGAYQEEKRMQEMLNGKSNVTE
jgi:hypothetical protein